MRVLILTALLACASAAPSGVVPLAALPAAPTIDPGDIQAAAINAQVQVEDQARAAVDSARDLNERVVEDNNEKVVEADSQIKEKTEEAFWSIEDKKWQALNAVQTAEAKLDGAVASNADAIARSALGGIIVPSYIVPSSPLLQAPVVSPLTVPLSPLVYTPALLPNKEELEKLEKEKEKQKELVKTAAPEKEGVKPEEEKKTEEKKLEELQKPLVTPILTPLVTPTIKLDQQWIAPVGPVAPLASVAYLPQPLLTPVIKTQW
ncbi:pupal cuticle protein PCP52-like [Pectinophora gossypiella]|uniref:pupal cuticle protein PCP52-like n=1 Tax=Pectinophora gossypiella TaxID=13191 RepID=UPI00214E91A4|nr:pupal cuticle protein PCP52-like [Pectinophora gossypiella]